MKVKELYTFIQKIKNKEDMDVCVYDIKKGMVKTKEVEIKDSREYDPETKKTKRVKVLYIY